MNYVPYPLKHFFEIRDGGPGWTFERKDMSAVSLRVQLLIDIFDPPRTDPILAIADAVQEAIQNG